MRLSGQLIGLFSYDIGHEIDLGHARTLLAAAEPRAPERRRAAPAHLALATPPLVVPLGTSDVRIADGAASAAASARIHEVGAVTVVLQAPLACALSALPALTATLATTGTLEDEARALLERLFARIRPAVAKPWLDGIVEDYYVVQVDCFEPATGIPELLAREGRTLASALRCEAAPLSDEETAEVLATRLSYYPHDLVVSEWNVALVVDDTDYADAVDVLEYLNVQLVELRYYDRVLDGRVADAYALTTARTRGLPLVNRPYRRALDELAGIRVDVATIVERLGNALKPSGDLYLAKLYTRTAARLALRAWADSVSRKLEVLDRLYGVLLERVSTARAETLELTIVLLIVLEIALLLAGAA